MQSIAIFASRCSPWFMFRFAPRTPTAPCNRSARRHLSVRTASANPLALAPILRREVSRARSELRVSNVRTQEEIDRRTDDSRATACDARAVLCWAWRCCWPASVFMAYSNYSVLQRHREIGIRLAIGAPRADIARLLTAEMLFMVTIGAAGGIGYWTGFGTVHRSHCCIMSKRRESGDAGASLADHS